MDKSTPRPHGEQTAPGPQPNQNQRSVQAVWNRKSDLGRKRRRVRRGGRSAREAVVRLKSGRGYSVRSARSVTSHTSGGRCWRPNGSSGRADGDRDGVPGEGGLRRGYVAFGMQRHVAVTLLMHAWRDTGWEPIRISLSISIICTLPRARLQINDAGRDVE